MAAHDNRMIGLLARAGIPMEQAPAVLSALENCILGSALDAVAPQDMWELPDPADAPHLAAALAAVAAESTRADRGTARRSDCRRPGFRERCRGLGFAFALTSSVEL
jgi:hypothetical protein